MSKLIYKMSILALIVALWSAGVAIQPRAAQAAGTVNTCDEASLQAAIAGGGLVTFACSGTINLTTTLNITVTTTVDATGQSVILDRGNTGPIFLVQTAGVSLTVINLTMQNALNNIGSAIGFTSGGNLTITNSTFLNNVGAVNGGAVFVSSAVDVTVTNSTFTNNQGRGGGALAVGVGATGDFLVQNSTFTNNSVTANQGGAIVAGAGTTTINDSTFTGNLALAINSNGGAIYNGGSDVFIINRSTFVNNRANLDGGAIANAGGPAPTVDNSTFIGNSSNAGSNMIAGAPIISRSTLVGTGANDIFFPVINRSILSNVGCPNGATNNGNNLSFPNACGTIAAGTDPLLGGLASNGGSTQTILPGAGSPAINAYTGGTCTGTDQRGVARPQGASCDIGSVEQAGATIALDASAVCVGNDLQVTISAGDDPFNITGTGPGLPRNGVAVSVQTFTGPGLWQNVTVTETTGDAESDNLGTFNCGSAGVVITESGGSTDVDETGPTSDGYTVVLTASPNVGETVTVTPSGFDTVNGVTVLPASVNFTDANWSVAQTITVTAVDDGTTESTPHTNTINNTVTSTGGLYTSVPAADVVVNITDNDGGSGSTAGLFYSPPQLLVAEDALGQNQFSVWLGSAPAAGETVTVNTSFDGGQLALSPTSLNFTAANWNVPQFVNVDAVPDGVSEDVTHYPINLSTTSTLGGSPFAGLTGVVDAVVFDTASGIVLAVPNHGLIQIGTGSPLRTFQSPSDGVVRLSDSSELWLPQDADGNGFDTFVVTDIRTYNDQTWLALWNGSNQYLWVLYDASVILIVEPLDWDIQSPW